MHENKTKFERNHSLEYYPMTCIRNIQAKEVYWPRYLNLACERQTFLLTHRRWGTFREEERLRLSDRIPYWWRKSGSHGVPNANLFNFTILLVDFVLRSFCILSCVHLRTSSSKTQMLLLEKNIFHGYCLFCYRFIAFILPSILFLSFVNNGETNVTCLVPRPHFSSRPKCFRSRDPCENVKMFPARSSRIRHWNELTETDWENAVQGLGNNVTTPTSNERLWSDSGQILRH